MTTNFSFFFQLTLQVNFDSLQSVFKRAVNKAVVMNLDIIMFFFPNTISVHLNEF